MSGWSFPAESRLRPAPRLDARRSVRRSTPRSLGNRQTQSPTTMSVPTPPITTDGTVPKSWAVTPDSNSPSSLLALTKTMFTALTRPRMGSGVASCTSADRTYTLIMSDAPTATSAASESAKLVERPKTIVASPKMATQTSILAPARLSIGRRARATPVTAAPTAGALRSAPSATGPRCRMSRA